MIEHLNLFQDLQLVFKIRVSPLPIIDMSNKTRASPLSFPYCPLMPSTLFPPCASVPPSDVSQCIAQNVCTCF